jgi:hypothetical protein
MFPDFERLNFYMNIVVVNMNFRGQNLGETEDSRGQNLERTEDRGVCGASRLSEDRT